MSVRNSGFDPLLAIAIYRSTKYRSLFFSYEKHVATPLIYIHRAGLWILAHHNSYMNWNCQGHLWDPLPLQPPPAIVNAHKILKTTSYFVKQ
jgi:hypothetical protein